MKRTQADMKMKLKNSKTLFGISKESFRHRMDQAEDRILRLKDKVEELDHVSKYSKN